MPNSLANSPCKCMLFNLNFYARRCKFSKSPTNGTILAKQGDNVFPAWPKCLVSFGRGVLVQDWHFKDGLCFNLLGDHSWSLHADVKDGYGLQACFETLRPQLTG